MRAVGLVTSFILLMSPRLVAQTTLEARVVSDGDVDQVPNAGASINVFVQARLSGDPSDGLAAINFNMQDTGIESFDLCDTGRFLLLAPTSPVNIHAHFDRNAGFTNPPGLGEPQFTGFSGTCDGNGGLVQLGGGQNTLGNTGPTAYPVGSVLAQVGNGGWVNIAEGTISLTGAEALIQLAVNTVHASVLRDGTQAPGPYDVRIIDQNVAIVGDLFIGCLGAPCPDADVNLDGSVNSGDILVVRSGTNWQLSASNAADPRADVNHDGTVNAGDILAIRSGTVWQTTCCP